MRRALFIITISLATLVGCYDIDCDTMAVASVQLSVVDEAGAAIDGATAEYTILEEGWFAPETCDSLGGGELVCGWELEASFEIWVEAEGYQDEFVEVVVGSDECHVITEMIDVIMVAE